MIDRTEIRGLNDRYVLLDFKSRIEELYKDFRKERILLTSSFGSTSIMLIHLFNSINPEQEVHFIDTTYHFKETLKYRNRLIKTLGLKVRVVKANKLENKFTRQNQLWASNPNLCCYINKINPLDLIKPNFDVWVSGLLRFQNGFRKELNVFEAKAEMLNFYPLIDITREEVGQYINIYDLPVHPLVYEGYDSISCTHCTKKGNNRAGRWIDSAKDECGLHY